MKKPMIVLTVLFFIALACSKTTPSVNTNPGSNPTVPDPTPATPVVNCSSIDSKYSTAISQIIQNSCGSAGCHGDGSASGPGALTSFSQLKNAAEAVKNAVQSGRMPKGGSLSAAQKQAIACWVEAGAPNN